MEIKIRCPHCQKKYRVPEAYNKRAIKCVECGYPFFVVANPGSPASLPPPLENRGKPAEQTQVAMPAIKASSPSSNKLSA